MQYDSIQLLRSLIELGKKDRHRQAVLNIMSLMYEMGGSIPADDIHDAIASAYSDIWDF